MTGITHVLAVPLVAATLALALALAAVPAAAVAADSPYFTEDGIALGGHDPVAYHVQGGPAAGDAAHTAEWGGVTWRFASAANRDAFLADPARYAPAYGGYCAYGVSQGYLVSVDPAAWTIVDGRLYLNYSQSVRRTWEKDIPGHIAAAETAWPGLDPAR